MNNGPTLMLTSDPNAYRVMSIVASSVRDIMNSAIAYSSSHFNKHKQLPDIADVAKYLSNNHFIKILDQKISRTLLALIVEHIKELLYHDEYIGFQFDNKYVRADKPIEFFIPLSIIEKDQRDKSISFTLGRAFNHLYNAIDPSLSIPSKHFDDVDKFRYMVVTLRMSFKNAMCSHSFELTLTDQIPTFEEYLPMIDELFNINVNTYEAVTVSSGPDIIRYMSIDLGSENFANVIETVTFKPFTIEIPYIFAKFAEYTQHLETCINEVDINERILQTFDQEKQLKRAIKFEVNKVAKHLLEYCKENKIDMIICGKTGFDFIEDQSYKITRLNFSQILQGMLRQTLVTESENYDIVYAEISEDKTSQYCCKCGTLDKKARNKKRNVFVCPKCKIMINGDINATVNLLIRYMFEAYKDKDKEKQIRYIYDNIRFDNLLNVEKVRLVKKTK